jgi:hypothetical protein
MWDRLSSCSVGIPLSVWGSPRKEQKMTDSCHIAHSVLRPLTCRPPGGSVKTVAGENEIYVEGKLITIGDEVNNCRRFMKQDETGK